MLVWPSVEPKVLQTAFLHMAAKHARDAIVGIALAVVTVHEGLVHHGFRQAFVDELLQLAAELDVE